MKTTAHDRRADCIAYDPQIVNEKVRNILFCKITVHTNVVLAHLITSIVDY